MLKNLSILPWLLCLFLVTLQNCASPDLADPPRGYRSDTALKMAYAVGALKLIETSPDIPNHVVTYKDRIYKETPEKALKLDIYHLNNIQEATPLLVFIHGGSWTQGDKDDYRRYLVDYAEKGYVTATVSYRFAQEAKFPAALEDVVCAIQWLKTNAEQYHIDVENIALIGGSAGGHLAMMAAYHARDTTYHPSSECGYETDPGVRAIVNFYGPVDLTTEYARTHPSVTNFIGKEYTDSTRQEFLAGSPLHFITPDDPPTLIFHGTLDDLVPVSQADTLTQVLKRRKVFADYHRLKGWPHTMDMGAKVNRYCQYYMDAFFEQHLGLK